MSEVIEGEFIDLLNYPGYLISNVFPFVIKRKETEHIVAETKDRYGYFFVYLYKETKWTRIAKHRLIAIQFIENPNNLPCVDHINRNRADNRLENLRWVTISDNNANKSSTNNIEYEFVKDIPQDSVVVDHYNNHYFEHYYYYDDNFYFYNGYEYRALHVNSEKNGTKFVCMRDINNIRIKVAVNKFKKLYELD